MNRFSKQISVLHHFGRDALLFSTALLTVSCAAIPNLGPAKQVQPADSYAAAESFKTPAAEWPADEWWKAYGDDQLSTLIAEALAGGPSLKDAEARVRQADALAQEAGAARLPQVQGAAAFSEVKQSYNAGIPAVVVPKGWNETAQINLSFSYEFDFWGKNRSALNAALSSAEAARADQAQARLTLAAAVAAAYADLAQLHADHDAALDAVSVRTRTVELLTQRFAQGLENQGAVKRGEAGRASAEAQLASIEEAVALTKNRIAALIGAGPDRGVAIARPHIANLSSFGLPANLKADLIGRRPDIRASRLRAEAAAQRINVAKADFYPNANLSGVIGLQSLGLSALTKSGSDYGSIGPAISLPIFTGGRLQGAYRAANAEYDAAVSAYDAAVVQALNDVADVAASERALTQRLGSSREALDASDQAYQTMLNRYLGGLATYLDVLSSEDSLIANRQTVADLETRAFALDVALVRALGGGFHN
jgi:NodT family efflux transporter outer membrane factor (OMF) lipoprotein